MDFNIEEAGPEFQFCQILSAEPGANLIPYISNFFFCAIVVITQP